MTHRIACLRAVLVTALPYFTRLPVSCLSQQTREQARAVTEFSVLLAVFYHFRFSLGFGNFPNFWVQTSRPRLPARVGPIHIQRVQVDFLFPLRALRVQFLAKFWTSLLSFRDVIPTVLQHRRDPTDAVPGQVDDKTTGARS